VAGAKAAAEATERAETIAENFMVSIDKETLTVRIRTHQYKANVTEQEFLHRVRGTVSYLVMYLHYSTKDSCSQWQRFICRSGFCFLLLRESDGSCQLEIPSRYGMGLRSTFLANFVWVSSEIQGGNFESSRIKKMTSFPPSSVSSATQFSTCFVQ